MSQSHNDLPGKSASDGHAGESPGAARASELRNLLRQLRAHPPLLILVVLAIVSIASRIVLLLR